MKKTYNVSGFVTAGYSVMVEADNVEEAKRLAELELKTGAKLRPDTIHQVNVREWPINL